MSLSKKTMALAGFAVDEGREDLNITFYVMDKMDSFLEHQLQTTVRAEF